MAAVTGQKNNQLQKHLQTALYGRMAASSAAILAALISVSAAAAPGIGVTGTAFDPLPKLGDKVHPHVPTGTDKDIRQWIQSGELLDAKGNPITDIEQFKQLIDATDKTPVIEINQNSGKLILAWKDFNIEEGYEVKFNQPSSTALALNKVENSTSPSQILGKLTANGGVYLINHNGILFGKNAQVNVGSLVATSLDIDEALFKTTPLGDVIKNNANKAAFHTEGGDATGVVLATEPTDATAETVRGDIAVEAGAKLHSTTLNGVVMVAPNVSNSGTIETPDGQTVLAAAKDEAYVLFSSDPSLRGLLIEVKKGGSVTNTQLGKMIAERGNITLAGLAVKNDGALKATTSVDANGTIRLLARDSATLADGRVVSEQVSQLIDPESNAIADFAGQSNPNNLRISSQGGELTLGASSRIEIAPEVSAKTAPDAQKQAKSGVELSGKTIAIDGQINAKGGHVYVDAMQSVQGAYSNRQYQNKAPDTPKRDDQGKIVKDEAGNIVYDASRITLKPTAVVDVSGTEAQLSADRNTVQLELRSNELADAPLQRNGFLKGQKIAVDVRKGTPLADITPALAGVAKTVDERLMQGGSLSLRSDGDVYVDKGAAIDVSGGGAHYAAGYAYTTNLVTSEGKIVNIGDADPSLVYIGIFGNQQRTNKRFNITDTLSGFYLDDSRGTFLDAYDQGADAGSFSLQAQAAYFQGNVKAAVFSGVNQRQVADQPKGGSLNLDLNLQSIRIAAEAQAVGRPEDLLKQDDEFGSLPHAQTLELNQAIFNNSQLTHYAVTARNGSVTIAKEAALVVPAGSQVNFAASQQIDLQGSIQNRGGSVALKTQTNPLAVASGLNPELYFAVNRPITLGEFSFIDTSGTWVNDNPLLPENSKQPITPLHADAGAVSLKAAGDLLMDSGSRILANGGGWLNSKGKLVAGKGGDVTLSGVLGDPRTDPQENSAQQAARVKVPFANLQSYAFTQGGKLSITAPSVLVDSDKPAKSASGTLWIAPDLFGQGGFSSYNLTASGSKEWISHFDVADFTSIKLQALNYSIGTPLLEVSTGTELASLLSKETLPDYLRKPVNLSFTLKDNSHFQLHSSVGARVNNLTLANGVKIDADPLASLSFKANNSIVFDGIINAKGGKVDFTSADFKDSQALDLTNLDDVGILLGENSYLDVSSSVIYNPPSAEGLTQAGKLVDAGSVSVSTSRGFVIAKAGSYLDLHGDAYTLERLQTTNNRVELVKERLGANAGSLNLTAGEGILWYGDLQAKGAGNGALGGELNATLDGHNRSSIIYGSVTSTSNEQFLNFDFSTVSYNDNKILLQQAPLASADSFIGKLGAANFGRIDAISDKLNASAAFSVATLTAAGFDAYSFTARNADSKFNTELKPLFKDATRFEEAQAATGIGRIELKGDLALVAGKSIKLNATTLLTDKASESSAAFGRALVAAPYVQLGYFDGSLDGSAITYNAGKVFEGKGELLVAAAGLASLANGNKTNLNELSYRLIDESTSDLLVSLNAPNAGGMLDLFGRIAVQGANTVTLASAGDMRTNGLLVGDDKGDYARYLGNFSVAKDLTLQADQLYPSTLSEFLFASGQRDFTQRTLKADLVDDPRAPSRTLNTVSSFKLTFEDTDAQTGNNVVSQDYATWGQVYDILSGRLGVGDSVLHVPEGASESGLGKLTQIESSAIAGSNQGKITILGGSQASPLLTAGGSLMFDAPNIQQLGTLKAPFGQISFNARGTDAARPSSVVIGQGSITSVSAENTTIPFGVLDDAGALVYRVDSASGSDKGQRLFTQSPAAAVRINAAKIDLQAGAKVDLSGGGDLQAYRFVPGPGGSKDVLLPENAGKSFVVIPRLNAQYAPIDPSIAGVKRQPGESIYLGAAAGLPEGEYAILPARYALLPGAYLITPVADGKVYVAGESARRTDGAPIVAGRYTTVNTDKQDGLMSGFVVEEGAVAKTRSEYVIANASSLFAPKETDTTHRSSPNDAANLSLLASKSINLNADILANVGDKGLIPQGLGGQLDISGTKLLVTDALVPVTGSNSDKLQLLSEQLNTANFDSILLGGRRSRAEDGSTTIIATAQQVEVAKNTHLSVPSLVLTAKGVAATETTPAISGAVIVGEGASIEAKTAATTPSPSTDRPNTKVNFAGDSLLRVSSGQQLDVKQTSQTQGDLTIAKGATLTTTQGSQLFLTNGQTRLNGTLKMDGGSLGLGSNKVSLGEVTGSVDGLVFNNEALALLKVDELVLTSASSIDLYGNVKLNFDRVDVTADSLRGFGATGQSASLSAAHQFTLQGSDDPLPANTATGKSTLNLSAETLVLDEGNLALDGFGQVQLTGSKAIVVSGQNNLRSSAQQLGLSTALLTGKGAANSVITSAGAVSVAGLATSTESDSATKALTGLGARLSILGSAIDFSAKALLPSGQLSLTSQGTQADNLRIQSGAVLDVSGQLVSLGETAVVSPAGSINLVSAQGDVRVEQGATLNISGVKSNPSTGETGGDAGKLAISALRGQALLAGSILSDKGAARNGASLSLQVSRVTDVAALLDQVRTGGFSNAFDLRVGAGDLAISQGQSIKANRVSLVADNGSLSVAGSIDASSDTPSAQGGVINLAAQKDLNLAASAQLTASAKTAKGGDITLGSNAGFVNVAAGAKLAVQGASQRDGGTVTFRVPRTQGGVIIAEPTANDAAPSAVGDDLAIRLTGSGNLADAISGAAKVDVDAFKAYNITANTSEIFQTARDGSSTFLGKGAGILHFAMPIPANAVCALASCTVIPADAISGSSSLKTLVVDVGQPLPVGALCGDGAGCSYEFDLYDDAASVANSDSRLFMQHAAAMEKRLFGTEGEQGSVVLTDIYHVKPELELRSTGTITLDKPIDFAKNLGVVQQSGADGSYFVAHDVAASDINPESGRSTWRFNDELVAAPTGDLVAKLIAANSLAKQDYDALISAIKRKDGSEKPAQDAFASLLINHSKSTELFAQGDYLGAYKALVNDNYQTFFNATPVFDPATTFAAFDTFTHGEAGVLAIRAGGDIAVNASVSDGFAQTVSYAQTLDTQFTNPYRQELSREPNSWSYHWVAGADLTSANTYATLAASDIHFNKDTQLRTGTGDIRLTAGGSVRMDEQTAIYSAGRSTGKGFYDQLTYSITNQGFDHLESLLIANPSYGVGGGNLQIDAGKDIRAAGQNPFVTDWLQRIGGKDVSAVLGTTAPPFQGALPTTWAMSADDFTQGVATLGGGDIRVTAGGNINNLSLSAATTGKNVATYLEGEKVAPTTPDDILVQGGGNLILTAGGDIRSTQLYVAKGKGEVNAGGDIGAVNPAEGALFELADAQFNITAGGAIHVGSILNPTAARFSAHQTGTNILGLTDTGAAVDTGQSLNYFYTYTDNASVSFTSLSGNVLFNKPMSVPVNTAPLNTVKVENDLTFLDVFAPRLHVNALQGSILVKDLILFPSAAGNLSLIAGNELTSLNKAQAYLNVADLDPASLPSLAAPLSTVPNSELFFPVGSSGNAKLPLHGVTPLYLNNPEPMQLVAGKGDISNIRVATPTFTQVFAGQDIKDVNFEFQQVNPNDVSLVKAGRDISFATRRLSRTNELTFGTETGISVAGFGSLDVIAAGDIKLGVSNGVQSIGAQHNPALLKYGFGEESGADVTLMAGIKDAPNYAGFAQTYFGTFTGVEGVTSTTDLIGTVLKSTLDRASTERFIKTLSSVTHRDYYGGAKSSLLSDQELAAALQTATGDFNSLTLAKQQQVAFKVANPRGDNYVGDLIEYVTSARFGPNRLDAASLLAKPLAEQHKQALTAFNAAPLDTQRKLVIDSYVNEVKQAGIQDVSGSAKNNPLDGFPRGYAAIAALFPTASTSKTTPKDHSGNISLVFSTVQTQQGGNINLLAPNGSIDVGVAAAGGGVTKDPSQLGLIALRNGNVNATVNENINVNSSRVFSLDGGDIMLWSSYGDLDAGRGAKTALSVPPPIINSDGSVNFQAAVSGSGIRNSRFTASRSPGAVYLFAPSGVVNAGDAGIGSQGDVLVAAQQVIGADNIDVGGVSVGIPVTTGVSAGVASASGSANAASDAGTKESSLKSLSESLDQRNAAFVTVDILGFDF